MQLADELWVSCMDDRNKTPKWQQETLEQRWSEYRSDKVKRISLRELERRLGGAIRGRRACALAAS